MRTVVTIAGVAAPMLLAGSILSAQRGRQGGPSQLPSQAASQAQQVVTVPEPATLALLGLGIGAAVIGRRLAGTRSKRR